MLADYQGNIAAWVSAVTTRTKVSGASGVYGMLEGASKEALEGISMCNLGSAALALRNLVMVSRLHLGAVSILTQTVRPRERTGTYLRAGQEANITGIGVSGFRLVSTDCIERMPTELCRRPTRILGNGKASDTCLSLLVAALISPMALLSGCLLYGSTPVMSALGPFMVHHTLRVRDKNIDSSYVRFGSRSLMTRSRLG